MLLYGRFVDIEPTVKPGNHVAAGGSQISPPERPVLTHLPFQRQIPLLRGRIQGIAVHYGEAGVGRQTPNQVLGKSIREREIRTFRTRKCARVATRRAGVRAFAWQTVKCLTFNALGDQTSGEMAHRKAPFKNPESAR